MSDYKIEEGVPLKSRLGYNKYPFGEMEIGDSFFSNADRTLVSSAASWYGKRNGRKYSTRKDGTGFRVWRIA